jgi:hypothetical protein
MMDDLVTLCMIGIIVLVGLALIPRLLGGLGGGGLPGGTMRRGNESPRYDDPDIESRGGFGGQQGKRSIFPRVGGTQSGGTKGSTTTPPSSSGGSRKYNSPDIDSRGGFGGDKS